MLSLFIFVMLIFNAATPWENVPLIVFKIQSERVNGQSILTCDHSTDRVAQQQSTHTVFEGRTFTINTDYNETINEILCYALNNENFYLSSVNEHINEKRIAAFIAEKSMGTQWKCTILAHLDHAVIQPVVRYKNHNYSAAYCYMGIHVRQKEAPQTILVNNMEMPAVRTKLSQEDVDFIAEYQYEDGDVVNVTCINEWSDKMLTMEYNMAGTMSDESTMNDLSSNKMIGFVTKLHSGHNNSYIICTHREKDDYTNVLVKFIVRSSFNNIVFLKINGMFVRPHLVNPRNNQYRIDYKYVSNQLINVTCEVERTDVKLLVLYGDSDKLELLINENRKSEMSFTPSSMNKHIECATGYLNGTSAETVAIHFTAGISLAERYPLRMEWETNGRVMMEVYNDYKLHVIYIEFIDGQRVNILCGMFRIPSLPGPILYVQLDSVTCNESGCSTNIGFTVTRKDENTEKTCYLKEKRAQIFEHGTPDIVRRAVRVIFRERVLRLTNETIIRSINSSNNNTLIYCLSGVVVIVFILVVLYYTIIKMRCCVRSSAPIPAPRIDPASVFYENELAVFKPINEREAAEIEEDHYEDIE